MGNNMKYPEEIYKNRAGHPMTDEQIKLSGWARERAYNLGYDTGYWNGYEAGMGNPLEGHSNLTAAISAGEPIDWERLDGLNVKCVNPDVGTLRGVLMRNGRKPDASDAWWGDEATASYINALYDGWLGKDGWTLYVEGEIPLNRKTAEQLKVGTYFLGQNPNFEDASLVCVGGWNIPGCKSIYYAPSLLKSDFSPAEWVVIKEYGTFQKPEGK